MRSFEWATPWWFLALPFALLPWIAIFRPYTLRFSALFDPAGGAPVAAGRSLRSVVAWLPGACESLGLLLVVAALARPQMVLRETVRESDGIDILLAIDTSGSMDEPDMGRGLQSVSRLDAARMVMARFIDGRPHDRVGLLVFGEEAFVQVPLTLDHDGLKDFVGQLEVGMAGRRATAVGDAVAVACKRMKELKAPSKVVILVTDGQSNAGHVTPTQAAQAASALGVHVYTVGVGGDQVDERTLGAVARTTGARFFRANDVGELDAVYKEIDAMEKSTAKVKEHVSRDELYHLALLPGLGAWLLGLVLGSTVLRRLP